MPAPPCTWLTEDPIELGRGEECTVSLVGAEVSRRHARIERRDQLWVVRDLGSTNGVHVNGAQLAVSVLSVGDVLRLGDCVGLVIQGRPDVDDELVFRHEHGLLRGPSLERALALAWRAAASELPVVIQGETGTGKELVARAVHGVSGRAGPLVAVNCAALPEPLAEAALFGYRKGAFTGAVRASVGYFRSAERGTLFLDEIADLALPIQAKLLRALEQKEVTPVGEAMPVTVDVRVVVATQQPLRQKVAAGAFRQDLAARLDGVTVVLPPLRERLEEVPCLFEWFVRKHTGGQSLEIDPRLFESLCLYRWPSNVRELELLARRLVELHPSESRQWHTLLPEHVRAASTSTSGAAPEQGAADGHGAQDARDFARLLEALRRHAGNLARAAAQAGISRRRAYRLLEQHPEVDPKQMRAARRVLKAKRDPEADEP
jgi:transcriptional regulator with PAS, ATPase and Fis domain